tara:strand:+ start:24 stop:524 length:501 start_codon:yes stop_codon:yes gene_type:complete
MKVKYISKPGVEYETDYPNAHDGDVMCHHCEEIVFDLNVEVFELGDECPECGEIIDRHSQADLDEFFWDEKFVDEIIRCFLDYDSNKKIVSIVIDGHTLESLKNSEDFSYCDSKDISEFEIESRIKQLRESWPNIIWKEEYFEDDVGNVLNPFEGKKISNKELFQN